MKGRAKFNKPLQLLESELSKQVTGYLEARGWRLVRMNRGFFRRTDGSALSFGEPGMPDWLAIHYRPSATVWLEMKRDADSKARCICLVKSPHQRCTACDQAKWQLEERARGATVWVVDGIPRLERYLDAVPELRAVQQQMEMPYGPDGGSEAPRRGVRSRLLGA